MTVEEVVPDTEPAGFNILRLSEPDLFETVSEKIWRGDLPPDTFLRLGCLGHHQRDEEGNLVMATVLTDLNDNFGNPESMSGETRTLIYGKLPGVLLDWNGTQFIDRLRKQDQMYYRKGDLVETIRRRREYEDKTVDEPLLDRRLRKEISICRGLAHGVWRALLNTTRPEWVDESSMEAYYQPPIGNGSVRFELDPEIMRRRIVSVAVFSDEILSKIHARAKAGTFKGLGKTGIADLRSLIAEEHLELF